jgi:PAS domain S-box-containing protein
LADLTYTLLIVEDAPTDRELYRRLLLKDPICNYELLEAGSVVDGLEYCRKISIDAILLDYKLPDGDGLKFLAALAAQTNGRMPPVVMLTGQGDESVAVRAMKIGAQDYLVKRDLTPELLQSSIRNAISSDRLRRQLVQSEDRLQASIRDRDRFFDLSIDLLAIASFEGYFTRLNPAWGKVLGYSTAELMAQPFIDFVHPEDLESTLAAAQGIGTGVAAVEFENRYRCKDGSYRWLLWNSMPDAEQNVMYAIAHDVTERKQYEAALQASERKFSAIFDQSFELMGIVSLDGILLEVNQTALDSLEARREDICGKYFWDTPWWHTEQLQQQLKDAIDRAARGEFTRYEVQFPAPNGATLTTDFSIKPVFDDAGKVWTIVAEAHNITERKRAERDLRESQQRLQAGIEVAGVGLARFDYATNLVALSPEAAVLYGFDPDIAFVTREQIHDTFHPDECAELEQAIAQVIDPTGTGWFARDHRVVWPSGEVRCLSVRKQVFFDRDGALARPSYAILAAIDITALKHTEAALRSLDRKFGAIFDQTFELLGLLSLEGVVLEVNQTALKSIDAQQSEIMGKLFWETPWWNQSPSLHAQLQQSIVLAASGQFIRYEMQYPSPSGDLVDIDFTLQPVFDETGRVVTILAEGHDITDRKQTQAALEQRNQELDSFAYIVSHDLKAPLRAVANLSEWIEEDLAGSLTTANQEQMTLLRSRVHRMESTIDGLIDYARVGRTDDKNELVVVAQLLAETIESLAPPLTFTISISPNLPTLYTKRLLLSQVFANLIGNGIKHHDRLDGSLHIGIAEHRDFYEFAIADDGAGIQPEYHDKIFAIFQAVNPQNRSDSTGIGLAIVKKIIEAEGGTIRLESQLGKGTTFYFTWPK